MAISFRNLKSENVLFGLAPVISNHILAISRRDAFICIYSNFSPKIGCDGNTPLSLVYRRVINEFSDSINPISKPNKTKLCMDILHTSDVMAIFVIFWLILAKIWFPWHRPLDACNKKCLLWIGGMDHENPLLSNRILVTSRRNAFIAILVPKLVAMATPLCPLCTAVSQMNFRIAQTLSQYRILQGNVGHNRNYGYFCDFVGLFGRMATFLRPLQPARNVFFGLVNHENPCYK